MRRTDVHVARSERTRRFAATVCATLAIAVAGLAPPPASARIYHVDPRGRGDAATIQSALSMASSGDSVVLGSGVYRGSGNRDINFEGKYLTLRSAAGNPDSCIVDCEQRGRGFLIDTPGSPHIDGVTVTNGLADTGAGAYCGHHCSPLFSNCIFRGNRASTDGGAIRCAEITELVYFVNCVFTGNSAGDKGGAVALCCCSLSRFENCTVAGNEAKEGSAFSCRGMASLRLSRSILAFHRGAAPIECGACYARIDSCDSFGNEGGNWGACVDSVANRNGNISVDPGFEDASALDFRLRASSPLRTADPTGRGIGARW